MSRDHPSQDPIVQQLQLLMSGRGYNFYDDATRARADDLLVRQRASDSLSHAAQTLKTLEGVCHQRFVPPATREQPYPPADALQAIRALNRLRGRLGDLEARIRGMATPTQDRVWWRFRTETGLLNQLLGDDQRLVGLTDELDRQAGVLTADQCRGSDALAEFEAPLERIEAALRDREQLLLLPPGS